MHPPKGVQYRINVLMLVLEPLTVKLFADESVDLPDTTLFMMERVIDKIVNLDSKFGREVEEG